MGLAPYYSVSPLTLSKLGRDKYYSLRLDGNVIFFLTFQDHLLLLSPIGGAIRLHVFPFRSMMAIEVHIPYSTQIPIHFDHAGDELI